MYGDVKVSSSLVFHNNVMIAPKKTFDMPTEKNTFMSCTVYMGYLCRYEYEYEMRHETWRVNDNI